MKMIEVRKITKVILDELGIKQDLLKEISFDIPDGKITSLVAPEYSNESILLKIISGLENSTSGSIANNSEGRIVYIPALPSSFPWLNVEQNLMIGKKTNSNISMNSYINMVGLEGYEKYRPHNSSIGFRFRISLARALSQNPSLIILDNPFRLMKPEIRREIYSIVKDINKSHKTSFLISTMDITEALSLADTLILMKKEPVELITLQIPDMPLSENWIINNPEKYLKIKNQIELSFKEK
jgi:ABC-type nitrate/sulfonate/bicarbonate transport system ATPase subunit